MKSFLEKSFDLEKLKEIDIQQVGSFYSFNCNDIKEEYRDKYDITQEMLDNDEEILIDSYDTEAVKDDACWEYGDFDDYEFTNFISQLIKKGNYYLIFLSHSRWNGASGYKIVNDIDKAFYRDYDCSQYVTGGSIGGKVLQLSEYHHDCPMGHTSYIVALTDKEYERLDNSDFKTIQEFAESMENKVVGI